MTQSTISPEQTPPLASRRDRWVDWAVIGVLVVALLLGAAVMALAQGQRQTATIPDVQLTVEYPQGWLLRTGENTAAPDTVLQAVDPASGAFKTTFQVRVLPILFDAGAIAGTEPATATLALVLNNLSLQRAQQATAYRSLEVGDAPGMDGQPAMEARYVYVHQVSDLFAQQMPVVVQGLDVVTARGDKAYVFTLLAADDAFAPAEKQFRRFVASAGLDQP